MFATRLASKTFFVLTLLCLICSNGFATGSDQENKSSNSSSKIAWQDWRDDIFVQAKKEKKLVLLDLKAVWCHWCHVMDEKTYSDSAVADEISKNFLPTHVDQDSRPDLAARYEDYGWPATIIFTPDGKEIVKKSGYITPVAMAELLRKVAKDPSPLPDEDLKHPEVLNPALSEELKKKFEADILDRYDQKQGSWDVSHKFIDANFAELYLNKSLYGDKKAAKWLKQTLDNNLKIHDPVWGGVYQYSTGGVWNEAHFEKIMSIQADNIRIYAQASLVLKNKKYLEAAKKTANYINEFLTSPEGGFYTSQDADLVQGQHSESFFKLGDKARRKQGIPRVDKNLYARENGWMIQALAALYAVTGEKVYLERAEKAAKWIQENRALPGGGFRHAEKDLAGPYLSDTSTMGSAFLRLYLVTGNRAYYSSSVEAAKFIDQNFKNPKAGFDAAVTRGLPSKPMSEENIQLARYLNLLFRYSNIESHQAAAKHAMKFLTIPEVAEDLYITCGVLQAASELERPPVHITLLGSKKDEKAKILWPEALRFPLSYQRVDWWDKSEGPLPANDVSYPELSRPAVFTCTESRCSLPAFEISDIQKRIGNLTK